MKSRSLWACLEHMQKTETAINRSIVNFEDLSCACWKELSVHGSRLSYDASQHENVTIKNPPGLNCHKQTDAPTGPTQNHCSLWWKSSSVSSWKAVAFSSSRNYWNKHRTNFCTEWQDPCPGAHGEDICRQWANGAKILVQDLPQVWTSCVHRSQEAPCSLAASKVENFNEQLVKDTLGQIDK